MLAVSFINNRIKTRLNGTGCSKDVQKYTQTNKMRKLQNKPFYLVSQYNLTIIMSDYTVTTSLFFPTDTKWVWARTNKLVFGRLSLCCNNASMWAGYMKRYMPNPLCQSWATLIYFYLFFCCSLLFGGLNDFSLQRQDKLIIKLSGTNSPLKQIPQVFSVAQVRTAGRSLHPLHS